MQDIMEGCCLVVMCGLPASGKSTFVRKCQEALSAHHVIHVEYDKLLTRHFENLIIETGLRNGDARKLWKSSRRLVMECLGSFLEAVHIKFDDLSKIKVHILDKNKTSIENYRQYGDELGQVENRTIDLLLKGINCRDKSKNLVCFIDDNMYYRSMRYEYYQLARRHQCSFAEIFMENSVDDCLISNRMREIPVPDDVITSMFAKLEKPNPQENVWEKNCLVINTGMSRERGMICAEQLISSALSKPLTKLNTEEMEASADADRVQCLRNATHRADLLLRRFVSTAIQKSKGSGLNKMELKSLAGELNERKTRILGSINSGAIVMPPSVDLDVDLGSKGTLYLFLEKLFYDF